MNNDLAKSEHPDIRPAIRIAPLGELRLWIISEQELIEVENGPSSSLCLNFALFLIGSGLSFLTTLLVTEIPSTKTFAVIVILTVIFLLVGVFLLLVWLKLRKATQNLAERIRGRMPPAVGIPIDEIIADS